MMQFVIMLLEPLMASQRVRILIVVSHKEERHIMFFEIAGYQLIEKLSEHATYQLYSGQRLQDGAAVLFKVLKPPNPAPEYLVPFWQEYEILRGLSLAGAVKVYALENYQQSWMIVAEDYGGRPLDQLGSSGSMEPEEYLSLALQLADIVG